MRLNKTEREVLRKWVKFVIPQMSKLEGFLRRTIADFIIFLQH
jgi:hypothetical protein